MGILLCYQTTDDVAITVLKYQHFEIAFIPRTKLFSVRSGSTEKFQCDSVEIAIRWFNRIVSAELPEYDTSTTAVAFQMKRRVSDLHH